MAKIVFKDSKSQKDVIKEKKSASLEKEVLFSGAKTNDDEKVKFTFVDKSKKTTSSFVDKSKKTTSKEKTVKEEKQKTEFKFVDKSKTTKPTPIKRVERPNPIIESKPVIETKQVIEPKLSSASTHHVKSDPKKETTDKPVVKEVVKKEEAKITPPIKNEVKEEVKREVIKSTSDVKKEDVKTTSDIKKEKNIITPQPTIKKEIIVKTTESTNTCPFENGTLVKHKDQIYLVVKIGDEFFIHTDAVLKMKKVKPDDWGIFNKI